MRRIFALVVAVFLAGFSGAPVTPDPMVLSELTIAGQAPFLQTSSATNRLITINPAQKTLILLVAGQSNWTNATPSLYTPNNSSTISQLNIYDGAFYSITSDVLGSSFYQGTFGPGNISVRLADLLVTNGSFNNVIIVNFAVGSTAIAQWANGGTLANRGAVAMNRLAAQGITPATTGVTFGFLWGQGESDTTNGTSQSAYATALGQVISNMNAAGFSGRFFICEETWIGGSVSAGVQAAQTGIIDNVTKFSGGNLDSLNASNRQADNTHFNDTGAAAVATLVYNAMHASGAPY